MSPGGPTRQSASYARGSTGTRFRIVSEPLDRAPVGTVIWAHAFAEEMNKSRRMCARMAHLLAGRGWRVVQTDLLGCGDSPGEFRDATVQAWIDDLLAELRQADPSQPCWVWGVRAGALLVPALAAERADLRVLLWQPALQGVQVLQQFLRLHAGARIAASKAAEDSDESPARRLKSGRSVEVGGYELSPALANGLEQARFELPAAFGGRVLWLEVSAAAVPTVSPVAREVGQQLQQRGIRVQQAVVAGPAFWQTQEIEDCDALLQLSLDGLAAMEAP